ncbi:uncharacterized protein LOC120357026 [Solenopsis invicta]|uniref:uncharacterized protein LOC120357026 n=1 Tax=Solenopsis invicta TaxID=13686 RepID=UPI00193EB1E3|nr:uncharacterized protein LOC120357026 [Solenopsis invicta]
MGYRRTTPVNVMLYEAVLSASPQVLLEEGSIIRDDPDPPACLKRLFLPSPDESRIFSDGFKVADQPFAGFAVMDLSGDCTLRYRVTNEVVSRYLSGDGRSGIADQDLLVEPKVYLSPFLSAVSERRKALAKTAWRKLRLLTPKKKLWETLEKKNINGGLIERLKEIYRDTRAAIRTKKGLSEEFKTKKGVRGIWGLKLGKDRVWMLAYTDDLVLLAKNREAMGDMMEILGRFLKERNLKLNTDKSKMMVFNKDGRKKKRKWEWGKKEIEEVQTFKYLGFNFNRRRDYDYHIKELRRKGRLAANMVWGLGERICAEDFIRRWMLFKYLVESVMSYGVELWGSRTPCYLKESEVRKRKNGEGIRALMRLRCGNMEVENKYWLKEEERMRILRDGER